jgi:hypothetical protein
MEYQIIKIRTVGSPGKGQLSFFEGGRDIPFDIKRIYYICDVPKGVQRGGHAHKNLSQLMFCPYGEIIITLDDGNERIDIPLDDPAKGLMISNLTWREMTWVKDGSVLAVAASSLYDPDDYIRDYDEFMARVAEKTRGGCATPQ